MKGRKTQVRKRRKEKDGPISRGRNEREKSREKKEKTPEILKEVENICEKTQIRKDWKEKILINKQRKKRKEKN